MLIHSLFKIFLRITPLMVVLEIFVLLSHPTAGVANERMLYVGKNATEAKLTFLGAVQFEANDPLAAEEDAGYWIDQQVQHLFGPMGQATYKSVPKGNHTISDVKVTAVENQDGVYQANYQYSGTAIVQNGPRTQYAVTLPIRPDSIYRVECTDSEHPTIDDFWYFWSPEYPGCNLQEGRDYWIFQATIERYENSSTSYPEYERLVQPDGTIRIHIFFGMDDTSLSWNPARSSDFSAKTYREVKARLLELGFKSTGVWTKEDIRKIVPYSLQGRVPFVENLEAETPRGKFEMRLFFGSSFFEPEGYAFHYFFKDALETASVVIYDGHSGLGGYLDLPSIEDRHEFTFRPNQNQYQIYYFNSCSSYTYYNTMYFGRKATRRDPRGTKNLDILTNGLATYFSVLHDTNAVLLKSIWLWANRGIKTSYQSIAKQIDSDNLFGINGDEDNAQ